ncbi:hypothetical protein G5714_013304 [Onychostoma macrolepis]|uniref:Uncharacterized protein n=1 Tax=Onychostoma macrolepis TaxID=369639 RepID=A0A7J6CIS7_9TELE|nr:hypothetical protein G5714_013304 [Onychostoma macrolepis]
MDETVDDQPGRLNNLGVQPTFLTGLAALFSLYYIFNLQYQEEAASTQEFLQRRFVGINPEKGTKAARGKVTSKKTVKTVQKKTITVNTKVSNLLKRLMDFEWDFILKNVVDNPTPMQVGF